MSQQGSGRAGIQVLELTTILCHNKNKLAWLRFHRSSFLWPGRLFSQAVCSEIGCFLVSALLVVGRFSFLAVDVILGTASVNGFKISLPLQYVQQNVGFLLPLLTPGVALVGLVDPAAFCPL
jgi:hypothetical protein